MKSKLLGVMLGAALLGSAIKGMYNAPAFTDEGSFDQRAIRKARRKSSRAKSQKRRRN